MNSTKRNWVLATQAAMAVCMLSPPGLSRLRRSSFCLSAHSRPARSSPPPMISPPTAFTCWPSRRRTRRSSLAFARVLPAGHDLRLGAARLPCRKLRGRSRNISQSWTLVMGAAGGIFAMLFVYHYVLLPFPKGDERRETRDERHGTSFREIITAYVQQEKIGVLVAFILLYRLGEAMLLKLVSPSCLTAVRLAGSGSPRHRWGSSTVPSASCRSWSAVFWAAGSSPGSGFAAVSGRW